MGNILVNISSITDYEDENNNIIVGFGAKEMNFLKQAFAELCDNKDSQNPSLSLKEFQENFSSNSEAKAIIRELFDFDQSGQIDFYKFVCGMSLINSADLEAKAELLWPVYCRNFDSKDELLQVIRAQDLSVLVQTAMNEDSSQLGGTQVPKNIVDKEVYRILKKFGKEVEGTKERTLSLNNWKEMFQNELLVIKLLHYFGCISRFGGGSDMPEWDPDLEEEIRKGEQDDDFKRIERIKNGIEHEIEKDDGAQDDPTVVEVKVDATPWKEMTQQLQPKSHNCFEGEENPPQAILSMEHVYGFRCHDTRNSLKCGGTYVKNDKGQDEEVILYHTASIGIVQFVKSKKQKFFMEHNDDITCLDVRQNLCVTGQLGSKPVIHIWDYTQEQMTSLYTVTGVLFDGIAKVCLSRDMENLKLAAVGLDEMHSIAIWDLKKVDEARSKAIVDPEYAILAKGNNTRSPCWDLKFTLDDKYLICAGQDEVGFFTYYGNMLKKTKAIWDPKMHPQSALCIGLLQVGDDNQDNQESKGGLIATGMFRGEICLWKNGKQVKTIRAHQGPCTAIITRRDKDKYGKQINGIISGGNDGEVKMWLFSYDSVLDEYDLKLEKQYNITDEEFVDGLDLQNERISSVFQSRQQSLIVGTRGGQVIQIEPKKEVLVNGHYEGELNGLVCHPKEDKFYTVGQDKLLASWDMNKMIRIDGKILEEGRPANCIDISPNAQQLVVGTSFGHILCYNPDNFNEKIKKRQDLQSQILVLKFDSQGRKMAVSYAEKLVIYEGVDQGIEKARIVELKVIQNPDSVITHLDFSKDGNLIRCNTKDQKLMFFKTSGNEFSDYNTLAQTSWATSNCIFGWDVAGIWPECSLGSDINAVDRSKNDKILISGDDFSKIKVFTYPAHKEKAAFSRYNGHAAAISNLKFNHNDTRIISLGGSEKSIIQWKFFFDEAAQKASDEYNRNNPEKIGQYVEEAKQVAAAGGDDDEDDGEFGEEKVEKGDEAGAMKPFKGNIINPTGYKPSNKKYNVKPKQDLELSWAHGFRTQYIEKIDECRNMCKFTQGGNIAYATAGLGIVFENKGKDSSQKFFQKHEEDIVSFAIHPNKKIIATGQMAQKGKAKAIDIFIWDAETMEVLANFHEFHLRAILYLEFSPDGTKLLTVGSDDDNSIAIFDWMNKRMITNSKVDKSKVNALCWSSETEFLSCGAKHLKIWTLSGTNAKAKNGSLGGGSFISQACAVYNKKSKKFYTGGCEGSIFEWNGNSGKNVAKNIHGAKMKVGSLLALENGQLISGGYDGKVILWDTTGGLKQNREILSCDKLTEQIYSKNWGQGPVCSLDVSDGQLLVGTLTAEIFVGKEDGTDMKCVINGHYSGETWGACTAPDEDRFCSSGGDNTVRLWDISAKKQLKATKPFKNDIRAIDWAKNGKFIVIADFQANLYTLNPKNLEIISGPEKTHFADKKTSAKSYFWIEEIKVSPNSEFAATGFHGAAGQFAYIEVFAVDGTGKLGKSYKFNTIFSSSVLHLDWSCDSKHIVANSQAYELRFFPLDGSKTKDGRASGYKDFEEEPGWATWTCKLGWPVQGVFQGVDYSDVNTVCRSNNKMVLATGDDNGKVNLFKYPVVVEKQVHKHYNGHSSHVTRVRFSADDNWLISTGGNDRTVLLWKTQKLGGEMIKGSDDNDLDDDEGCGGPKPKPKKEAKKPKEEKKKKGNGDDEFGEEDVDKGDEFAACKPWLGAIKQPSDFEPKNFKNHGKKPKVGFHKEYVWGYRCKDTRNNIRYLSNGKIVYHAAGVGIVLDQESNTQQFFNGHIDDITAMDVHPDGKTIITGEVGPKPNIYVWDAETMTHSQNIKAPLQKGIANLQFSPDGSKFAAMAIDVDHQVAVFDTKTGQCLFHCDKNPDEKIEIAWNGENEFATCGPKGLQSWALKAPLKGKKESMSSKLSAKYASVAIFKGKYFVGASDGSVQGQGGTPSEKIHTSSVQMLQDQGNILLSGGNDGVLNALDGNLKVLWSIKFGNKQVDEKVDVEIALTNKYAKGLRSAAFDDEKSPTKLVVGLYSSEIHEFLGFNVTNGQYKEHRVLMTGHYAPAQQWLNEVWGLDIIQGDPDSFVTCSDDTTLRKYSIKDRKQTAIIETILDSKKKPEKPDPKTKDPANSCLGRAVGVNPAGTWAVVGMKDGTVKRFNIKGDSFSHYSTFKHAKEWISDVKFSPDGDTLCIGSHDNAIYGYHSKGDKGWKMWNKKLNKHSSYITHFDFSTDGETLHSTCGAYELLFWDVKALKQNPSGATATKDEEWASWNVPLGWPVQGIWPECADGTDINGVDRSHNKKYIATSDDFGTVNVFNYPCIKKGASCRQGKGHSSHVTSVKWTMDDSHIITTGGEDQTVILWKVVEGSKDEWEVEE